LLPSDRSDEVSQILEKIKRGEQVEHYETVRVRKDGRQIAISLTISPIKDAAGNITGASTIARDITAHKRTEEALQKAHDELELRVEERTREIERRRQVAEGLRDILAILNSNRPLNEILDYIVAQISWLLETDASVVYHLQNEDGLLNVQAAQGLDTDSLAEMTLPVGQGFTGQAVLKRQPLIVPNVNLYLTKLANQASPESAQQAFLTYMINRYRAMLSIPLIIKDEVYGAISLYYYKPREFSNEEVSLATAFADQAALAIENARLRAQVEQSAVAAERNRLARDLHDAVTQTLFSASLIAEVLPRLWDRNRAEGKRRLEELRQLTRGAMAEMRTLLLELRPATLREAKLDELLRHLTEAITGQVRTSVRLKIEGDCAMPTDVQVALYRITQEALNNVAKHARAGQATVSLRCRPERVELNIKDDGQGFELESISPEHLGLGIMHERAETIGATLKLQSQLGQGTQIEVVWPNPQQKEYIEP
jgi:signal transduction histidine kinase